MGMRIEGFLVVLVCNASATVNIQNASYKKEVKIGLNSKNQLTLIYNSRSNYRGIFGFGWCSPFERQLLIYPNNKFSIKSCDQSKDVDKVSQIEKTYQVSSEIGEVEIYSAQGRLLSFTDSYKNHWVLIYDKNEILSAFQVDKDSYDIKFVPNKIFVELIKNDSSKKATKFSYEKDNLTNIASLLKSTENRQELKKKFTFSYDKVHNLVIFKDHQGLIEKMYYNVYSDQIIFWQSADECRHNFRLSIVGLIETIEVAKSCPNQSIVFSKYKFTYKASEVIPHKTYLFRLEVIADGKFTDIQFNETNDINHSLTNFTQTKRGPAKSNKGGR